MKPVQHGHLRDAQFDALAGDLIAVPGEIQGTEEGDRRADRHHRLDSARTSSRAVRSGWKRPAQPVSEPAVKAVVHDGVMMAAGGPQGRLHPRRQYPIDAGVANLEKFVEPIATTGGPLVRRPGHEARS